MDASSNAARTEDAEQIRAALVAALRDKGVLPDDPEPAPGLDEDIRPLREALALLDQALGLDRTAGRARR